ncbi:MAG: hypothetical protein ACRBCK_01800 [Alphaproteobacteria bacterium]
MNNAPQLEESVAEKLPENPMTLVQQTIIEHDIVQVAHDVEIASTIGAANNLQAESIVNASRAGEHMAQQTLNETEAMTNFAGAEIAANEDTYHAHAGSAEKHSVIAQDHHVQGTSASAISDSTAAESNALERASVIQMSVMEESQRIGFAVSEEADRTNEATKQEMKVMAAVQDSGDTAGAAQDLEAQARATVEASAPKIG